jgi:hypothetical protein
MEQEAKEGFKVSKIYLFSAKARHGKDTACEYFKNRLESEHKKVAHTLYAKYIKGYAKEFFGWDGTEENKPRKLLQELGTDIIRKKLKKPSFHVDRICDDIEILSPYFDRFLISDVRFPNEIYIPKARFGEDVVTIRIVRTNFESPLTPEQQNHESETALDTFKFFDYIVYAKNIKELYEGLDEIYKKEEYKEE